MRHHYTIKARAILAEASADAQKLQAKALELLEKGRIDEKDLLFLEQDAIRNKIMAAQTYAMMVPEAVEVNNDTSTPPEEEPLPDPETEPNATEAFFDSIGETLEFLRDVGPLLKAFAPRPVKDTPQA